jgi:hypothetical protein
MLENLKKIALIGTERADISEAFKENIAQLGIPNTDDAATATLQALALHTKAAQARIVFSDKKINLPIACLPEKKPYIPEKIGAHFFQQVNYLRMYHATQFKSLLYFLNKAKENGMVVPPKYVANVVLFSRIKTEKEPRTKLPLLETLGEHGKWMLYNSTEYRKIAPTLPQKVETSPDFFEKEAKDATFEQLQKEIQNLFMD